MAEKTPAVVVDRVVAMVRDGRTRGEVSRETGLHVATVSTIVRRTPGVEFARTGQGSSGTPEAMAKARGVQSQYARNRRAELSERILDATARTLDLLEQSTVPRERQYLSQALRNHTAAYSDLTVNDAKAAPDMSGVRSLLDGLMTGIMSRSIDVPPEQGTFEE